MIKYALQCEDGHSFESWFGSSTDYDRLSEAGHVSCIVCGSASVQKAIMAPRVALSDQGSHRPDRDKPERDAAEAGAPEKDGQEQIARPLSGPLSPAEAAVRKLRKEIEKNSEDVGKNFAEEARAIHNGEAPERSIIGQARGDEAKALLRDGIPVAPLPWTPKKTN